MKFFAITLLSIASLSFANERILRVSPGSSPKGSPQKELIRKLSASNLKRLERSQQEKIKDHRLSSSDYVAYKAALEKAKTKGDLNQSVKDALEESEGLSYSPATIQRITSVAETVSKEFENKAPEEIITIEQELKQQEKELDKQLHNEIIPQIRTIANARAEYENRKREKKTKRKEKLVKAKQKRELAQKKMWEQEKARNKKVKLFFKKIFKKNKQS